MSKLEHSSHFVADNFLSPEESLGFERSDDFGMSSSFPVGFTSYQSSLLYLECNYCTEHLSDKKIINFICTTINLFYNRPESLETVIITHFFVQRQEPT